MRLTLSLKVDNQVDLRLDILLLFFRHGGRMIRSVREWMWQKGGQEKGRGRRVKGARWVRRFRVCSRRRLGRTWARRVLYPLPPCHDVLNSRGSARVHSSLPDTHDYDFVRP